MTLAEYCSQNGKKELLAQWDRENNFPLTPENLSYGSKKKVWWICAKGHRWQAPVYTRTGRGVGCPYCGGNRPWPGETDLATRYPELARQWHPTKNGSLTPADLLPGSQKKVWWQCEKGHEWQAQVKSRVSGCGCPVCANRKIVKSENDLAALYPQLAQQWHPTKNGDLTPEMVTPGSRRKVWWRCEKGHEWQAIINSRTAHGTGCPYCGGQKVLPGETDLASRFPNLAKEWDRRKNGNLMPDQVTAGSNRKVWWLCPRGHSYRAMIAARTMRSIGCPYCAGRKVLPGFNDLATTEPAVAAQWHPFLNGALTPQMVTAGSRKKVWWVCSEGHIWKANISSRTGKQKCGCPVCAGMTGGKRQAKYAWMMAEAAWEEKKIKRAEEEKKGR